MYVTKVDSLATLFEKNKAIVLDSIDRKNVVSLVVIAISTLISTLYLTLLISVVATSRNALAAFAPVTQSFPKGVSYVIHSNKTVAFLLDKIKKCC